MKNGGRFMAEKSKKPDAPRSYSPRTNYTTQSNLTNHFSPYNGSATFRDMKKKAEQAMSDHEFKD
jgi:hypothetical protein